MVLNCGAFREFERWEIPRTEIQPGGLVTLEATSVNLCTGNGTRYHEINHLTH